MLCNDIKLLGCKLCDVSYDGKKPLHVRGSAWAGTGRERSSGMQINRREIVNSTSTLFTVKS